MATGTVKFFNVRRGESAGDLENPSFDLTLRVPRRRGGSAT